MRNPLSKCWRDLFKRPSKARFIPTVIPFDGDKPAPPAEPKPHPRRRKTDRWRI